LDGVFGTNQLAQKTIDAIFVIEGKHLVFLVGKTENVCAAIIDANAAAVAPGGVNLYRQIMLL
jgi:hypothetical protein